MIIIIALMVLVPALMAVLFYERFKGYELILRKRIELFLIFAFIINMLGYIVLWLRGWTYVVWTADIEVGALTASFVVQYMAISSVTAIVMAYMLSLVRVEKREDSEEEPEEASALDIDADTDDKSETSKTKTDAETKTETE